jgi:hypothetical protein
LDLLLLFYDRNKNKIPILPLLLLTVLYVLKWNSVLYKELINVTGDIISSNIGAYAVSTAVLNNPLTKKIVVFE